MGIEDYRGVTLTLLSVTALPVAILAQQHLGRRWRGSFFGLYALLLLLIALLVLINRESVPLVGESHSLTGLALLLGLAGGRLAFALERVWLRRLLRASAAAVHASRGATNTFASQGFAVGGRLRYYFLAIAVLEELLFRGVLLHDALAAPTLGFRVFLVSLVIVMFAGMHVGFGVPQAIVKLVLSVVTTALVTLTGELSGAITAHAMFNVAAFSSFASRGHGAIRTHG